MQWIVDLMNSPNGTIVIMFGVFAVIIAVLLSKRGLLGIHTKYVTIGAVSKEDTIKQQQMKDAYSFIMALGQKIDADNAQYNGYKTKFILELIYDEVVNWIVYNHIRLDEDYIKAKQDQLRSVVYNVPDLQDAFRSPEFAERMDRWTKELIGRLIRMRKVYSKEVW